MNKQKINRAIELLQEAMQEPVKTSDFIFKGEWVEVRDSDDQDWKLDRFIGLFDPDYAHPYKCTHSAYMQCRRPIDAPDIVIRWFGGEMPEELKGRQVTVWTRGEWVWTGKADGFIWRHDGTASDTIEYRVMGE